MTIEPAEVIEKKSSSRESSSRGISKPCLTKNSNFFFSKKKKVK